MNTNENLEASRKVKYNALKFCSIFLRILVCVLVFYIPGVIDASNPYMFSIFFLFLSLIALSVYLGQESHKYKQEKNKDESNL